MLFSIRFFGRTYPMYGICCVSGFIVSLLYIVFALRKNRQLLDDAVYVFVLGVIGGLIGAKCLYLLTIWPAFSSDFGLAMRYPALFAPFVRKYLSGGMVLYGGILGGILSAYLASRYFGRHLRIFVPVFAPALALLCAFGRIGCFCAGCCYGKPVAWGVVFPKGSLAPAGVPLIPTQLIEAGFDFCLCVLMTRFARSEKKRAHLLTYYLVFYAAFRFIIEFFRGDMVRGVAFGLSTAQWISLSLFAVLLCIKLLSRRSFSL